MYPPPQGPELSPAASRALDDQYLASDPTAYFRSRIRGLLAQYQRRNEPGTPLAGLSASLGNVAQSLGWSSPDDIELQVVIDAVQLRHHVSESLLRLLHSRYVLRTLEDRSLWMQMTESPRQMKDIVKFLDARLRDDDVVAVLGGLLLPVPPGTPLVRQHLRMIMHAVEWIARAMLIVSQGHIDMAAASNKIRHGAIITASNDRRIELITGPLEDPSRIPRSAFNHPSASPLTKSPVLEYLSQPPKADGMANGHERTLLNVEVEPTLAEAWLIALVHGALFYGAAYRHHGFDANAVSIQQPPWVIGPSPSQLLRGYPLGFRFPLTTSPDGKVRRPAGMATWDGGFIDMTFGDKVTGVVVD